MATPAITEPEARALADAIVQVSGSQPAEAQKLVDMALARAPDHPLVLNSAGGYLARTGNAAKARELFERALSKDPKSKVLWLNLANACRALGDSEAEGAALEKALALEPRYLPALLQKANLLERTQRPKAAALAYTAALDSLAPGVPVPQHLVPALTHAREAVAANALALEEFLEREVESARKLHAADSQERYDACRDVVLRKRRVYTSQPKYTHFPYLPAIEFFPREYFPWLATLEAATEEIASEALAALERAPGDFSPYVNVPPGTPVDEWAPLNGSMSWSVFPLWHDGAALPANQAICPRTTAVLAQLPMCDVPGFAPGAFFSVLKPRTRLPPHTGTTNTRSIVHLPLVIPEGCRFRVGSQVRSWEKGKAWVFDDTIEHDAWNDSEQIRIILIFDIWNPLLTSAERELIRAMTVGLGNYYGVDAPTLGSR
jgi:aspartyl/asparaginyl beta-hydroxylase (cupin superfamily)